MRRGAHLLYEDLVGEGGISCNAFPPSLPAQQNALLLWLLTPISRLYICMHGQPSALAAINARSRKTRHNCLANGTLHARKLPCILLSSWLRDTTGASLCSTCSMEDVEHKAAQHRMDNALYAPSSPPNPFAPPPPTLPPPPPVVLTRTVKLGLRGCLVCVQHISLDQESDCSLHIRYLFCVRSSERMEAVCQCKKWNY